MGILRVYTLGLYTLGQLRSYLSGHDSSIVREIDKLRDYSLTTVHLDTFQDTVSNNRYPKPITLLDIFFLYSNKKIAPKQECR